MFVSAAELEERAAEGALMEQAVELAAERAVELLAVGLAAQLLPKLEGNSTLYLAFLCDKNPSRRTKSVDLPQVNTQYILDMSAHRAIALPWLDDRPIERIVF